MQLSENANTNSAPLLLKIGLTLAFGPAAVGIVLLPVMVGALSANGVSSDVLGILGFLEFCGMGIGALVCAALVTRTGAIAICFAGGILMLGGHLVSAFSAEHMYVLFAGRAVAGLGGGLAVSGAASEVARARLGAGMYGLMVTTAALLSACGHLLGPYLVPVAAGKGVFFISAGFGALVIFAASILARHAPRDVVAEIEPQDAGAVVQANVGAGMVVVALAIATLFAYTMGEITLWAFIMPIGQGYGLSLQEISYVIVFGFLINCFPPLFSGWLERNIGIIKCITIASIALVICNMAISYKYWSMAFVVFLPIRFIMQILMSVFQLALFAKVDPSGRAVSAAKGCSYFAMAVSAPAAGFLADVNHDNYVLVGALSSALFGLALVIALWLGRMARLQGQAV